jgi:hypothetical protein
MHDHACIQFQLWSIHISSIAEAVLCIESTLVVCVSDTTYFLHMKDVITYITY